MLPPKPAVHRMPDAFSNDASRPSLLAIPRPICPKCRTRMSLARVARGLNGFDRRTFQCLKCSHAMATVETDFDGQGRQVAVRWRRSGGA
jgi:hypothetical protein